MSISQIVSASYNAVVNNNKKAANQWEESALMNVLERQGGIVREDLGPQVVMTLDFQRNPAAGFQSYDLQPIGINKTEVLTEAQYTPAELVVPVTWSMKDEAMTPSVNAKVAFTKSLLENAMSTHNDLMEQYLFATSTNGFLGLLTHVPDNGQSSDGGIDSTTITYWRSQGNTYVDDTDIESAMTITYNQCAKGTGAKLVPTICVSDATTQALFEGTQQPMQRWQDQTLKAGFTSLMFKTCTYVFSQYGGTRVYFLNPKNFKLVVSKSHYMAKGETMELEDATGYRMKMYSALQSGTNNRSRLGVAHT